MTRYALLALTAALLAGCTSYDGRQHAQEMDTKSNWAGKVLPEPIIIEQDGKIFVAASKESAEKVRVTGKFPQQTAAFGAGPNGETIVYEQNRDGVEEVLMMQYAAMQNPAPATR